MRFRARGRHRQDDRATQSSGTPAAPPASAGVDPAACVALNSVALNSVLATDSSPAPGCDPGPAPACDPGPCTVDTSTSSVDCGGF